MPNGKLAPGSNLMVQLSGGFTVLRHAEITDYSKVTCAEANVTTGFLWHDFCIGTYWIVGLLSHQQMETKDIMRYQKTLKTWLFMLAITLGAWTATAIPIDGGLSFAGGFGANNPNLTIASSVTSFSNVEVTSASGTFAAEGIVAGAPVTLNAPLVFDPLPGSWTNPLWSVGGFSFAIESIEDVDQESFMGATLLEIKALGTISHADFDDTSGVFLFTGNSARGTLSFSASSLADAPDGRVPDSGSSVILLGMALAGLGIGRRLQTAR